MAWFSFQRFDNEAWTTGIAPGP